MTVDSALGADSTDTAEAPQSTAFTPHELLYLLSVSETPSAAETRKHLMLPDGPEGDSLTALGAATLLVRNLATIDGETIELTDTSRFLAWVCSDAHTWIEVGLSTPDKIDGFLIVVDPLAALIFTPAVLGIYSVLAMDDVDAVPGFVNSVVSAFLAEAGQRSVVVRRQNGQGSAGLAGRTTNGRLEVGDEITRADGTLGVDVPIVTAAEELTAKIAYLLG